MSLNWQDRAYFKRMGIKVEPEIVEGRRPCINWGAIGAIGFWMAFWAFMIVAGTRHWK